MKFSYIAMDTAGKRKKGTLDAEGEAAALAALRAQRLVPVKLAANNTFMGARRGENQSIWDVDIAPKDPHKASIPPKKLIMSFNQIAIMLRAGVNLSMALEVMVQSETHKVFKKILRELHSDLLSGVSLSDSMSKFACFDSVSINLVRAGEADGHLDRSFAQIVKVHEKQHALIAKVRSAAVYPCILLVLIIGVLTLLNTMVLPSFVTMFETLGTDIPAITLAVMGFSEVFNRWWWAAVLLVAALVYGNRTARKKSHAYRLALDKAKLRLPLAGKIIKNAQIARFARILSTLLESGQDFLSALHIGQSVLTNQAIIDGLEQVADNVRAGASVSASMAQQKFFDAVFISMLRAGEESGSMSETLSKMADLYEDETDESTKRLVTAMEPMMTVVISIIVGVVVIAIAIPMFSMFDLVGNV